MNWYKNIKISQYNYMDIGHERNGDIIVYIYTGDNFIEKNIHNDYLYSHYELSVDHYGEHDDYFDNVDLIYKDNYAKGRISLKNKKGSIVFGEKSINNKIKEKVIFDIIDHYGDDIDFYIFDGIGPGKEFNKYLHDKIYKNAQVWENKHYDPEYLDSIFEYFYELEYKRHMIISKPFNGMEIRRQNILKNIDNKMSSVIEAVKNVLIDVYEKWLQSHAITDIDSWAMARVNDMESIYDDIEDYDGMESIIDYVHNEYMQRRLQGEGSYNLNRMSSENIVSEYKRYFVQDIFKNIDKMPCIKNSIERWLNDVSIESAEDDYENEITYDMDFAEDIIEYDMLSNILIQSKDCIKDLYSLVFPYWFQYFQPLGIEDTRKNIENVYNELKSINSSNISSSIVSIHKALNAVHQSGDMKDYIEQYTDIDSDNLYQVFDALSNSDKTYVPEWNEQLKEVGVQI